MGNEEGEENNSGCGFSRPWFEGAVHDFHDAAGEAVEEISQDLQDRVEEKMEEVVNTAEDHLRSRVVGTKDILQ